MLADLTLTWVGCFLADWTSQQPNQHPSSRCPCPSPCPPPPLLTKKHPTHIDQHSKRKIIREKVRLIEWIHGNRQLLGRVKVAVSTQKLGRCGCHGNRLTYLAVSSACNIHVKDELSLILGAVGPWWAAEGHRWESDVSILTTSWEKKLTQNSSDPVKWPLLVTCWTLITTMCLEDISKSPSRQSFGLGCVKAAYFALKPPLKMLVWVSFPVYLIWPFVKNGLFWWSRQHFNICLIWYHNSFQCCMDGILPVIMESAFSPTQKDF